MNTEKFALIITSSKYLDSKLSPLPSADQDASELKRVLSHPEIGNFEVATLENKPHYEILSEIENFISERKQNDLLLIHFSGHGLKDLDGKLYFAAQNTQTKLLKTTAIPAGMVNELLQASRAKQIILILDCCYGGAYLKGIIPRRAENKAGVIDKFESGRGFIVITASDALQYAYEGEIINGKVRSSVFTGILVDGIESGKADLDRDGFIGVNELYEYVYQRIIRERPEQKPEINKFRLQGDILIAKTRNISIDVTLTQEEAYKGVEKSIKVNEQELKIVVKPRTKDGSTEILKDLGLPSESNLLPGDLIVTFRISQKELNENYKEPNQDLFIQETDEIKEIINAGNNKQEEITNRVWKNTENSIITALNSAQNTIIKAIEKKQLSEEGTSLKIAILYKRNATPEEELLNFLEDELSKKGHQIFIDRHLKIGVDWAKEIESQIRASDVVMILLSISSIQSEMLAYEIQIAYEESQKRKGKPFLLPIRVNYEGKLPMSIAGYLDHLQYALYDDSNDKFKLIENLLESIYLPTNIDSNIKLEAIGGAVSTDSNFYITRTTDKRLEDAIENKDSIILIKGPRQVGKTSLLARGLKSARGKNNKVVLTDFQQLNFSRLETIEKFYLALGYMIAEQLELKILPDDIWKDFRPPNLNFEHYLRREVLGKVPDMIVWGLDEVDILFTCPYGSEVFGFIRSLHNARALDPNSPWFRLTMLMAYATEAHLFITDLNQSPFNVGTKLTLEDFNITQLKELNKKYGDPLNNNYELEKFYALVGGHPYLVRRGLHEMIIQNLNIGSFESICVREDGPFGDHLRRFLVILAPNEKLSDSVKAVIAGQSSLTDDTFHRLRSAGLLVGDSAREAKFRCKLYELYLKRHLV